MNQALKNHIKKIARQNPDILAVFLYGSRADDSATPLSDADLAILLTKDPESDLTRLSMELDFEEKLSKLSGEFRFDIRTINYAPILVKGRILTEGKCLYCTDDEKLADYREKILLPYLDFRITYDALIDEIYANRLNDR
jgi:predicted nucleotidyltransferase